MVTNGRINLLFVDGRQIDIDNIERLDTPYEIWDSDAYRLDFCGDIDSSEYVLLP